MAQFGRVLEWGSRGRRFESSHSDHYFVKMQIDICFFLISQKLCWIRTDISANEGERFQYEMQRNCTVPKAQRAESSHSDHCFVKMQFDICFFIAIYIWGYLTYIRKRSLHKKSVILKRQCVFSMHCLK